MIKKIWGKSVNRETIMYLIFGILTTLTDWMTYALMKKVGIDYRIATMGSWAAAVLFAYVTNKLFVFRNFNFHVRYLMKELTAFVACRAVTGILTLLAMIFMVDYIGIKQDFLCKVVISAVSLILNYIFSKLFIFRKKTS